MRGRVALNDARALHELALRGDGILLQSALILAKDLAASSSMSCQATKPQRGR